MKIFFLASGCVLGMAAANALPPPHDLPEGAGTLRLITPGDPMALPGQGDGPSSGVGRQIAGDGRTVAFGTQARNLAGFEEFVSTGGVIASMDVGVTRRISGRPQLNVAYGSSEVRTPAMSRDGSSVAVAVFMDSYPLNFSNVYLVDVATGGQTVVADGGGQPMSAGWSLNPSISADGGFVAFDSLVAFDPADTGLQDVYLWSRETGERLRISRAADGGPANGASTRPSISDDGSRIAFVSHATNLAAEAIPASGAQVWLADRASGSVRLVSRNVAGAPAYGGARNPMISPDGRFVAFLSEASDLVAGDLNQRTDAFVFDSVTGTVNIVSVGSNGTQVDSDVDSVSVCEGGQRLVFVTRAGNLDPAGSQQGISKVYLRDLSANSLRLLGRPTSGGAVQSAFAAAVVAPDCGSAVYASLSSELGPSDANDTWDVYREAFDGSPIAMLSRWTGAPPPTALIGTVSVGNASISADGERILLDYQAANMLPGDDARIWRTLVVDRSTGARTRIGGPVIQGQERPRTQSALAAGMPVIASVARVEDGVGHTNSIVVTRIDSPGEWLVTAPDGPRVDYFSSPPRISADGSQLVFGTQADLLPGLAGGVFRAYFTTIGSGAIQTISPPPFNGAGFTVTVSADGLYAAYVTRESLVVEDVDGQDNDVYRVDLRTREHQLMTGAVPFSYAAGCPALSGNGQMVAFCTNAPASLELPDCPGQVRPSRVLVRELGTGVVRCGSIDARDPLEPELPYAPLEVVFSPNGRWLAYRAQYTFDAALNRIFVTDLQTNMTRVVDRAAGVFDAVGSASGVSVSDRGQVVFSTTRRLVPEATGVANRNVYLFEPPGVAVAPATFRDGFENAPGN